MSPFVSIPVSFVPLFKSKHPSKQSSLTHSIEKQVGILIDETGAITSGKLVWSDEAWEQLLGRNAEGLAAASSSAQLLRYLENRLLFLRLALLFGWSGDVGKIVVLRVGIV